jgi:type II secretory pathway pseudopilin PulG
MCDLKTSLARKKSLEGFTLLEILAALFLFAIMTMGIASTMRETTSLTRKVKSREATTMSAVVAVDRLQKDLQMAYNEPFQGSPSFFKSTEATIGPELSFSFMDTPVKTLFQRRTAGEMIAFYRMEKAEDGSYKLLRSEVPYYAVDKLKEAPTLTLAEGVLSFKVEFYDSRNDRWAKEWDTKGPVTNGYFPKAARVSVETVDTSIPSSEWKNKSLKIETDFLILNEANTK